MYSGKNQKHYMRGQMLQVIMIINVILIITSNKKYQWKADNFYFDDNI